MKQAREKTAIMHGDRISALGFTFTVDRILYQDPYGNINNGDCDIEFIDTKGNYHHWKQCQDKGQVFRWKGYKWENIVL